MARSTVPPSGEYLIAFSTRLRIADVKPETLPLSSISSVSVNPRPRLCNRPVRCLIGPSPHAIIPQPSPDRYLEAVRETTPDAAKCKQALVDLLSVTDRMKG